jgi:hypothetical protein
VRTILYGAARTDWILKNQLREPCLEGRDLLAMRRDVEQEMLNKIETVRLGVRKNSP